MTEKEIYEEIINYIKTDAEIAIPIGRYFNVNGGHITKNEYGKILLEVLCEELENKFLRDAEKRN